jgi:uncharacterized BrkB/YihY/UPF0761 family membrane protein
MDRYRRSMSQIYSRQPFWKRTPLVLGVVMCLILAFACLAYLSGQKAASNASNGAWLNHIDF